MKTFVTSIAAAVAKEIDSTPDLVEPLIQTSANREHGDLALPCFKLAAALGKPGKEGAMELAERLASLALADATVEVKGPYVNFRLDPLQVAQSILTEVASRTPYGSSDEGAGKTILIDFSSPNIAKPFHLGHLRSTVIGWSLRQIFRALGYEVVGINHLGDWGTQFGFMIAAWTRWREEAEERVSKGEEEIEVFASLYARINTEAKTNPQVRDEARDWFKKLEDGDAEARRLWQYFVDRSKLEFARVYELLGIVHESEAGESFYEDRMPATVEQLKASGLLSPGKTRKEAAEERHTRATQRLEGAQGDLAKAKEKLANPSVKEKARKKATRRIEKLETQLPALENEVESTRKNIPIEEDGLRPQVVPLEDMVDCMLLKADGGTTYTTRDVTAAFYRAETYGDPHPTQMLYVVGSDQRDHFLPWFKVIEKMGLPWASGLHHVGFGRYLGMSTRAGTSVFLKEVLERAREKAKEAGAQATKKVELSDEEAERVARAIGTAAIKFFDLRAERTKDINLSIQGGDGLDWDRLLDLKGDTGPYLQFAYARLAGILRKYDGPTGIEAVDFTLLSEPEAQALIKTIGELPARIAQAAEQYEPSIISRYLIDLAQRTHLFVHHHRVIDGTPTPKQAEAGVTAETLRATRVFLVECAKKVLKEAFELLGIEALEQM